MDDPKYQPGEPPAPESLDSAVIVSPDTRRGDRIPPGQSRTRKWPVLDAFGPPQIDVARWKLRIFGLVRQPLEFTLEQFQSLPRIKVYADFHGVTRWSRLGNAWEGVSTRELLDRAGVDPQARYVLC